ncbi:MAG: bifunctional hydroxymethylpyrimidine kinase/phosphomethylpyrimidine kinase, partial [Magnetococcales bacterium]|nr:bifunctional hydroxymethylpyrimidine kinase/phosphomethylpyrimidine kinase [Magnetococcales bacterium]
MSIRKLGRVLIVAGSDPVAGAGLQADLKTVTALGGYGMTAVTAITVQDTQDVFKVVALDPDLVGQQIRVCLQDIGADCIKLGMLATQEIVAVVAKVLAEFPHIPVVADPVLAGTGGGVLLEKGGYDLFMTALLPRLTLLTPNLPESAALTGLTVVSLPEMEQAARRLQALGSGAVLVTGGHLEGAVVTDVLVTERDVDYFQASRLPGPGFHGTGCVLASAIATHLAFGRSVRDAVMAARLHVREAMTNSLDLGKGQR